MKTNNLTPANEIDNALSIVELESRFEMSAVAPDGVRCSDNKAEVSAAAE